MAGQTRVPAHRPPSLDQSDWSATKDVGPDVVLLRRQFPPRPVPRGWPATVQLREAVQHRLSTPPFRAESQPTRATRHRGVSKVLDWLTDQPGQNWQQRWQGSGAEATTGSEWTQFPLKRLSDNGNCKRYDESDVLSGLLTLVCADVIRPSLAWLLSRRSHRLVPLMAQTRDPDGFAQLRNVGKDELGLPDAAVRLALTRIATIMAAKGGLVCDVTVGDSLELADLRRSARTTRAGGSPYGAFYQLLHATEIFPENAPATLRIFRPSGQLTVEQLVDRYNIEYLPVRDVIVDYLRTRQPALDYTTLTRLAHSLGRLFWRNLEVQEPGIDSLRLAPDVVIEWKRRLQVKETRRRTSTGESTDVATARHTAKESLLIVRAFYLDIAQWAVEDPSRWARWVAPCPIQPADIDRTKDRRRRKARMDQRTRERLPVLPALIRSAEKLLAETARILEIAAQTATGDTFEANGETLLRPVVPNAHSDRIWADNPSTGQRRDLTREEDQAFWSWAIIEVLRHTGIRVEELLELSHHCFVQYRLPSTGELLPLLQIAPSKTDTERLLLISPELADVLSSIVRRVRGTARALPVVPSYDNLERLWNAPMPLLFQRRIGSENRAFSRNAVSDALNFALAQTGLTDADDLPLHFTPHDFRRLFVTEAVMNGLPPHIAQIICGHQDVNTTMGYKAVYPEEAINAHRAFMARRRAERPESEYRTPTEQEWEEFLGHFEKRKVSLGTCGRAVDAPCIHEHACVRCSLLRPDPSQLPRLTEIRNNLLDRIDEAEREGWRGEVQGLQISLAGAQEKLEQMRQMAARGTKTHLGMPDVSRSIGRISTATLT